MKRALSLTILATAVTLASCVGSREPTAPEPRSGLLPPIGLPTLLSCPTTEEKVGEAVIGPEGGVLRVGPHALFVPAGALSQPTTLHGTAPVGNYVELKFEPEGLQFAVPASLNVSYRHCGLGGLFLSVVFVDDGLNILEILPSRNNIFEQRVRGEVSHFSSYMLAN